MIAPYYHEQPTALSSFFHLKLGCLLWLINWYRICRKKKSSLPQLTR